MAVKQLDLAKLKLIDDKGDDQELNTSGYKYIGLYFAAESSSYCKEFTPKLDKYYKEKRKKREGPFEIVFVSSDNDKYAFDDCFSNMPWYALKFEEKEKKAELTALYSVTTLPKLVILTSDGIFVSDDGQKAVDDDLPFHSLEPPK